MTVLILQNTTDKAVLADAHFWDASGARLATRAHCSRHMPPA